VVGIHDLHVWQIDGTRVVATAHVSIAQSADVRHILHSIQKLLHQRGLHASTIQPELVPEATATSRTQTSAALDYMCTDTLCADVSCKDKACCN
jgi:zinc transporter 1